MMNKKAIAAFAAGATLLAGFAMATPAFAADKTPKAPTSYKEAQDAANTAATTLETAKKTAKEKADAADKAKAAVPADKDKPADADGVKLVLNDKTGKYEVKEEGESVKPATRANLQKYADAYNANVDAQKASKDANDALAAAQKAYDAAVLALRGFTPDDKDDDAYSIALSAAATKLKTATAKLKDAFAKANKLYGELKAAKEKAAVATKTLADFKNAHDDMNKRDVATLAHLQKAKDDADAAVTKLEGKFSDASGKFDDAFTAYSEAFATYNTNFYAAKDHKDSLVLGYSTPENIELRKDYFQYGVGYVGSSDEVTTPGAPAGQPGAAQPGKPGAPAAGANGAAGKAGAKTEVENKNGKDKRGNTHTGTGVGVTLTALAATMLAGMGAAVRKARH